MPSPVKRDDKIQGYKEGIQEAKTTLRFVIGKLRRAERFKASLTGVDTARMIERSERALMRLDSLLGEKIQVPCFYLQETLSFPDGAPQREEYDSDEYFLKACKKYDSEWVLTYVHPGNCENRDCPQCFPSH